MNTAYITAPGIDTITTPPAQLNLVASTVAIFAPDGSVVAEVVSVAYKVPLGSLEEVRANFLAQVEVGFNSGKPLKAVWL